MNNNLTEVTASFKEQLQSVRAHYHSLQSQYFRVNDEIHKIAEAPPSRSDLERLLIKAIDAYALFPTTKLTNVCERFTRDPQGEDDIAQRLADGFRNYPVDHGLPALYLGAMREEARQFAQSCEWPDNGIDLETRLAKIAELEPKRQALMDEMCALSEQLEKAGIVLKPT
jgi:hypothetical protein